MAEQSALPWLTNATIVSLCMQLTMHGQQHGYVSYSYLSSRSLSSHSAAQITLANSGFRIVHKLYKHFVIVCAVQFSCSSAIQYLLSRSYRY